MFLKWGAGAGDSISIITIGYYLSHNIFPDGHGKKTLQPPTLILMQTSAADMVACPARPAHAGIRTGAGVMGDVCKSMAAGRVGICGFEMHPFLHKGELHVTLFLCATFVQHTHTKNI